MANWNLVLFSSPNTPPKRSSKSGIALILAGLILSLGMMLLLHGSQYPTAFYVIAGTFLPLILSVCMRRFARLAALWRFIVSLCLPLLAIWGLALYGKYPRADLIFGDVFGRSPTADVQSLTALRGWFDGSITILRFHAPPNMLAQLVPAKAKQEGGLNETNETWILSASPGIREKAWIVEAMLGWIIDPNLRAYPGWQSPQSAEWPLPPKPYWPRTARMLWDRDTGAAVVIIYDNP